MNSETSIPLSRLRVSTPQAKDAQGAVLSDEKVRTLSLSLCEKSFIDTIDKSTSFPSSNLAILLQRTVERRVDDVSDEGKDAHAV